MNMDAVYGASVAATASRAGALALTVGSISGLPASVNPLDTAKELRADQKKTKQGGLNDGLIFGLLLAVLVVWIWWGKRRSR